MEKVIKGGSLENTVDEIAKEIIKRDNAVSDESIAAVGALQEEVSSVKSAFTQFRGEEIKEITGNEIIQSLASGYYETGSSKTNVDVNTIKSNPYYVCSYKSCVPGDVFYYTGEGTSAARSWAFLNANGDIISRATAGTYSNEKLTAPENASTIIFNANLSVGHYVIVGNLLVNRVSAVEDKTVENESEIESVKNSISAIGSYSQATGTGEIIVPNVINVGSISFSDEPSSIVVRNAQLFEAKLGNTTLNNVSLTNNNDGSFTLNGTPSSGTWFYLNQSTRVGTDNPLSLHGTYTITIEIMSGSLTEMTYCFRDIVNAVTIAYTGTDAALKLTGIVDNNNVGIAIQARKNIAYNNFRFRIMVNKGIESYKWADYKAPHTITGSDNVLNVVNEYIPCPYIIATPNTVKIDLMAQVGGTDSGTSDEIKSATIYKNDNLICANHRGYHQGYPENTLWAFAQSKLHGFLWIENDVRFTSDGVGVLLHDESINRTARNADGTEITGTVNIADITYAQACEYDFGIYAGTYFAGTKIVTIEECIAFCKAVGLGILCEPKVIGGGTYCANLVKAYAMEDSVIWISFVPSILQEVNTVLPNAKVGLLTTQDPASSYVDTAVSLKTTTNSVFLGFDYRKPITSIKQSMIQNGIGYAVYTLDLSSELATIDPYCFEVTSNTIVAGAILAKNTLAEWM